MRAATSSSRLAGLVDDQHRVEVALSTPLSSQLSGRAVQLFARDAWVFEELEGPAALVGVGDQLSLPARPLVSRRRLRP